MIDHVHPHAGVGNGVEGTDTALLRHRNDARHTRNEGLEVGATVLSDTLGDLDHLLLVEFQAISLAVESQRLEAHRMESARLDISHARGALLKFLTHLGVVGAKEHEAVHAAGGFNDSGGLARPSNSFNNAITSALFDEAENRLLVRRPRLDRYVRFHSAHHLFHALSVAQGGELSTLHKKLTFQNRFLK